MKLKLVYDDDVIFQSENKWQNLEKKTISFPNFGLLGMYLYRRHIS